MDAADTPMDAEAASDIICAWCGEKGANKECANAACAQRLHHYCYAAVCYKLKLPDPEGNAAYCRDCAEESMPVGVFTKLRKLEESEREKSERGGGEGEGGGGCAMAARAVGGGEGDGGGGDGGGEGEGGGGEASQEAALSASPADTDDEDGGEAARPASTGDACVWKVQRRCEWMGRSGIIWAITAYNVSKYTHYI